jgi:hypothetical protein
MADLYVSLSRTAGILDKPVATIDHLRNDPAFPRKYSFDIADVNGRPVIVRGPFFRFDEIQQWKQRAGDIGNWDPPPDKRKTAAPADTRRDGIDNCRPGLPVARRMFERDGSRIRRGHDSGGDLPAGHRVF